MPEQKTLTGLKMIKLEREKQKELLQILFHAYPNHMQNNAYVELKSMFDSDDTFVANLLYLEEHELIHSGIRHHLSGYSINPGAIMITAKGIDFIQQDGGLSAILNVQTIKFHRDAVIVLEDLIAMSNMTSEQKKKAKSTLGEMSTEALKTVVQAATTAGISVIFGK